MPRSDVSFSIASLRGAVQHYAWGGYDYIPHLLDIKNAGQKPFAELWLGAHANAPSIATVDSREEPLDTLITNHPAVLGPKVRDRFGRLPFLLKVLDARDMLSIQVHPSKKQAEAGFARENTTGVPIDAPERNYKDDNHKPEVHVALTDFWMLHGFRPEEEIERQLHDVNEFAPLRPLFISGGLEGLYRAVMTAPQEEVDAWLRPLLTRLEVQKPDDPDKPDYWALKAAHTFPLPDGRLDRGIFSVYLLNLLHLKPGEGTFQDAGVLHAYLQGTNVELMANSDNVLRGGLTPKHVDVAELLTTVTFVGRHTKVLRGERGGPFEQIYTTPAADFQLSRLQIPANRRFALRTHGPEIWLVLQGDVDVKSKANAQHLCKGNALFVAAHTEVTLSAAADSMLYRAAVPE